MPTHWLLPVDPLAHRPHLPADWRSRPDVGAVWTAIGRDQDASRWCLSTGYRTMRTGDLVWVYLSRRQELCALGSVRSVEQDDGAWYALMAWDAAATAVLGTDPVPRRVLGQVPVSVCRANPAAAGVLDEWLADHGRA